MCFINYLFRSRIDGFLTKKMSFIRNYQLFPIIISDKKVFKKTKPVIMLGEPLRLPSILFPSHVGNSAIVIPFLKALIEL